MQRRKNLILSDKKQKRNILYFKTKTVTILNKRKRIVQPESIYKIGAYFITSNLVCR